MRGQPDYGLYTQTPVASGISDPGEAAARLGGINVYDRRGWTVWMDDFELPELRWAAFSSIGSPDPVLSTDDRWMGAQSVYFATVAGVIQFSELIKSLPLIRRGRVGFEFFIRLETHGVGRFHFPIDIYDGTNLSEAALSLNVEARIVSIQTPLGIIPIATDCFRILPNTLWTPIKLVLDMDTDKYVRLIVGPDEYDISAYGMVVGAPSTEKHIQINPVLDGDATDDQHAYFDNFILTQNEP